MSKEAKNNTELQICQMTNEMLEDVTRIHINAFKGAMNTRIGKTYIRRFFDWFIKAETGIALVAILKNGKHDKIAGYVIGVSPRLGKAMDRDLFYVAFWSILIRPWLFLSYQFRATLKARLRAIFKISSGQSIPINLSDPVMSLVGIAVDPGYQGHNIGRKLLREFEVLARERQFRSLKLSVYPENLSARCIYEKCGWIACVAPEKSDQAMFYYKKF